MGGRHLSLLGCGEGHRDHVPRGSQPREQGNSRDGGWGLWGGMGKSRRPRGVALTLCVCLRGGVLSDSTPLERVQAATLCLCGPGPLLHLLSLSFLVSELQKIKPISRTAGSTGDPRRSPSSKDSAGPFSPSPSLEGTFPFPAGRPVGAPAALLVALDGPVEGSRPHQRLPRVSLSWCRYF